MTSNLMFRSQTSELVSEIVLGHDDIQVISLITNPGLGKNFYFLIIIETCHYKPVRKLEGEKLFSYL